MRGEFFCVIGAAVMGALCAVAPADDVKTVRIVVDTAKEAHAISPYIYGMNSGANKPRPLNRLGGNRWSAYNWENNASNAGNDWHNQSDGFLCESDTPGEAVRPALAAAAKNHQALIVTVPMCGYVSADKKADGDVNQTANYLAARFKKNVAKKNAPLSLSPDLTDACVYQDEFVNWVEHAGRVDPRQVIFYSLDNEPDLWSQTHARIHADKLTYAELAQKTIEYSKAIKEVKPDATVFGFVSYGWNGFRTLQNAPDGNGRDFVEYFLAQMKQAEQDAGKRLVDVLDLHWYPEAQGGDVRVTEKDASPAVAAARVQAPRSLWDPSYTETSWITRESTHGPIVLIPRIRKMIDANYPGTKLALTEYTYGAGNDISGGIAEADALGIFGRENLFAAAWWDTGTGSDYVNAALDLYLNCDGKGAAFGDTSIAATSSDIEATSAYASIRAGDPSHVTLILINRSRQAIDADVAISDSDSLSKAEMYRIDGSSPKIQAIGAVNLPVPNNLKCALPAMSVTAVRLSKGNG
jgi:hypothetical protein